MGRLKKIHRQGCAAYLQYRCHAKYHHVYKVAESVSLDLRWAYTQLCLHTARRHDQAEPAYLKIPSARETNRNPKAKAA